MCDIEIQLPPIPIQQKYVDVYNALVQNQKAYEKKLEDLVMAMEISLEEFKYTARRVSVGELLIEVDDRNINSKIKNTLGINISKDFMPSVANLSKTDLAKYKIISKGQFAYSAMQTGRDECIRIALYYSENQAIISPAYSVLQTGVDFVLAEYIMIWFSRKESDRYGWFISDSSIRSSLELNRFFEIEIPVPDIAVQQSIVNIYNGYQRRRELVEKLKAQIKDICSILIKGAMEEREIKKCEP
jgi:type I restriction enzyme S subunit